MLSARSTYLVGVQLIRPLKKNLRPRNYCWHPWLPRLEHPRLPLFDADGARPAYPVNRVGPRYYC